MKKFVIQDSKGKALRLFEAETKEKAWARASMGKVPDAFSCVELEEHAQRQEIEHAVSQLREVELRENHAATEADRTDAKLAEAFHRIGLSPTKAIQAATGRGRPASRVMESLKTVTAENRQQLDGIEDSFRRMGLEKEAARIAAAGR